MGIKGLDHFRKAEYYYSIGSDAQSKINLSIIRKNLTKGYKKLDITPHDFDAFPTFSTKLEWHEAGAGFLIGSKGHVLTSRQTVVKANQIRVRFQDGRALDAKPIRIFIIYNIALLKVDDLSQYPKTVLNFGSSSFLKYGEDVLIPDPAPDGKINDFPRRGSIRAINALEDNDKFFQIDLPIQENQNGAPLFNSKGNIVGMVFSKSFMENSYIQTKNLSDDSSFAIKSIYLQQILGDILKITTPSDQPNPLTLTNNYQKFSKEAQMNLVVIETIP